MNCRLYETWQTPCHTYCISRPRLCIGIGWHITSSSSSSWLCWMMMWCNCSRRLRRITVSRLVIVIIVRLRPLRWPILTVQTLKASCQPHLSFYKVKYSNWNVRVSFKCTPLIDSPQVCEYKWKSVSQQKSKMKNVYNLLTSARVRWTAEVCVAQRVKDYMPNIHCIHRPNAVDLG